jgi:N4-gp56 family major capsid protein
MWPGAKFYSIIHPDVAYDMKGDSTIVSFWTNGAVDSSDNPLLNYELGTVFGVKFFQTTQAKINTSIGLSGADIYCTLVFGQNAYGVVELDALSAETIYHSRTEGGVGGPLDQSWTLGWKASHTAVILDDDFIQRIETTSSYHEAA